MLKKIIALLLIVTMALAMAVQTLAATPAFDPVRFHMDTIVVDGHNDILNRITRQGANVLNLPLNMAFRYIGWNPDHDSVVDHGKIMADLSYDIRFDTLNLFNNPVYPVVTRDRQLDLPKMEAGGLNVGMFAAWTNMPANPIASRSRTLAMINTLYWNERINSDIFAVSRSYEDIRAMAADGMLVAILTLEGGDMFTEANGVELVRQFADLGVQVIAPVHTTNTPLAADNVLQDWGAEVIREMWRQGILVDLSHMTAGTFEAQHASMTSQTLRFAASEGGYPLIHTHGRPRLGPHQTAGMWNEQLAGIAESGGVLGVMMHIPGGLTPADYRVDHIVQNIHYAVQIMGVEHVGFGTDADGAITLPTDMRDVSELWKITQGLYDLGYSQEDLAMILGENFMRTLRTAQSMAEPRNNAYDISFTPLLAFGEYGYYVHNQTPRLEAMVQGEAESFRIIVNGIVYEPEFDPATGILSVDTAEIEDFPGPFLRDFFHVVTFEATDADGAIARETIIFYVSSVMEILLPGQGAVRVYVTQAGKGEWVYLDTATDSFSFAIDWLPLDYGFAIGTGYIEVRLILEDNTVTQGRVFWADNTSRVISVLSCTSCGIVENFITIESPAGADGSAIYVCLDCGRYQ